MNYRRLVPSRAVAAEQRKLTRPNNSLSAKRTFIIVCGLVLGLAACKPTNPQQYQYKNNFVYLYNALGKHPQNIFQFKNISKQTIIVDMAPYLHTGASAGWANQILPGKSARLTISRKQIAFACYINQLGSNPIACDKVLQVTQDKSQPDNHYNGGFWL